ncbi:ankyrin repeat-containing domain protein [Leptodontidium sp. MPI-SDFR-AT-0119]|nr:ankyrin repeat-containing domain protein [Leptodontidium sp. MPI-SDFR-AT-0119]
MDFLGLPQDLCHKILLHAVISRGVTRALRLKLVCKRFRTLLRPALFESRLLDDFCVDARIGSTLEFMEHWYIRKIYGAQELWHSYLLYRVQNETGPGVGRFVEIQQLANTLCQLTEAELKPTLEILCWLALERGSRAPGHLQAWGFQDPVDRIPNPGLNLLSAVAYFGHIDLARNLLSEGHCPTRDNYLFPSPMQLAAWAGNADMLRLFQEHLPDFEYVTPHDSRWWLKWRGKTGPGSIKGAVMLGDMNMIRLAIYPPSRSGHDNTDFAGQTFGHVDPLSETGIDLHMSIYCVRTWDAFQYIDTFFAESFLSSEEECVRLLAHHTELGNMDMGGEKSSHNPLIIASRYGHEDVVDLLLQRGADPEYSRLQASGSPLCAAASGGSMNIVRKLLDHGASLEHSCWEPLHIAIRLEHTAMVKLFLDLGDLTDRERERLLRQAANQGLESMTLLILSETYT